MKEIGGYIEFETYSGSAYHDEAIALNSGRHCLAYLLEAKKIKKIRLPYFLCSCIQEVCKNAGTEILYYHIDKRFRPVIDFDLQQDEWLYIVNYYGQIDNMEVASYKEKFHRVIFDNAQSYFQKPAAGMDTLYTCRKFFGVSDGGFLYTDKKLEQDLPMDESFERIHYILGRYERTASEFYAESADNNEFFAREPIRQMSKLTNNLLRSYDYEHIIKQRTANYAYLHEHLRSINPLNITIPEGAFMYPLYIENSVKIRKRLQQNKIYIPVLWPDVFDSCVKDSVDYIFAQHILPLPVDQRYNTADLEIMLNFIMN